MGRVFLVLVLLLQLSRGDRVHVVQQRKHPGVHGPRAAAGAHGGAVGGLGDRDAAAPGPGARRVEGGDGRGECRRGGWCCCWRLPSWWWWDSRGDDMRGRPRPRRVAAAAAAEGGQEGGGGAGRGQEEEPAGLHFLQQAEGLLLSRVVGG